MGKYKKCPRCELNWIPDEEELCEVCKAELGKQSKISLIEDDEEELFEERVCPVCKVNYLADDEDICPACKLEQAEKKVEKIDVEEENWEEFVEDDEPVEAVEDEEISLSLLQEEEEEDEDDEFEDNGIVDDFDESIPEFDGEYDEDDEEDEDDDELI